MSSGATAKLRELGVARYLSIDGLEGLLHYELAKFFINNPAKPREVSARTDNIHNKIRAASAFSAYGTYAEASQPRRVAAVTALEKAGILECCGDATYELRDARLAADFVSVYEQYSQQ